MDRDWDVIVIGTGIGGGTIGRSLAEQGLSVLFVEQGPDGPRTEQTALNPGLTDPVARNVRGFWPDPVQAQIDEPTRFQYRVHSDGKTLDAEAIGDLDCDGISITYKMHAVGGAGTPVVTFEEPPPGAD